MNHLQNSNLIAAAIGVTVGVISAASIFIYHKILENQQHTSTTHNLDAANKKIAELQAELDTIRVQQSQRKKRKALSRRYVSNDSTYTATDNDTDIDAFSTAETDVGDDEFYDCSDSESVVGDNETRISEAMNHLDLVLNEGDEHAEVEFEIKTYYKLQSLLKTQAENVDVVWRFARVCYKYFQYSSDLNTKKAVILEGIAACEKILEAHQHADLYKWYGILIGLNGEYMPMADKIKNGYRYKEYIAMALEMHPCDGQLHHLLGRFQYEVANLSWFERKIAATLFAKPPTATFEDAIESFEQAEKLAKPDLENRLFLSKSYIGLNLYQQATDWLDKTLELPAVTEEERNIHTEASKLLNKYSGYRL